MASYLDSGVVTKARQVGWAFVPENSAQKKTAQKKPAGAIREGIIYLIVPIVRSNGSGGKTNKLVMMRHRGNGKIVAGFKMPLGIFPPSLGHINNMNLQPGQKVFFDRVKFSSEKTQRAILSGIDSNTYTMPLQVFLEALSSLKPPLLPKKIRKSLKGKKLGNNRGNGHSHTVLCLSSR